jgi:L-asparaginase/Glu-tRNA(Gln) amidotransferase subunit D
VPFEVPATHCFGHAHVADHASPVLLVVLQVYLASQCHLGPLKPELYKSGALALEMGVEAGPQMTPECAVVKMMLCLAYPDLSLGQPLAGEL